MLQIDELKARITELHSGALLHQQTRGLSTEMLHIHKAAAKLKSIRNELSGAKCASEVCPLFCLSSLLNE